MRATFIAITLGATAVAMDALTFSGATRPARLFLVEPVKPQIPGVTQFGIAAAVGDLTGDLRPDIALGEPQKTVNPAEPYDGAVYVFPYPFVDRPLTVIPDPFFFSFGGALAIGDLNGAPPDDLVVGNPGVSGGPFLVGFRFGPIGAGGTLLWNVTGYSTLHLAVADVTGDGSNDLVLSGVGGWGIHGVNAIKGPITVGQAYHGPDIETPPGLAMSGGNALAFKDVNHDGIVDAFVGDTGVQVGNVPNAGQAVIFYGPDLQTYSLLSQPGPQIGAAFGAAVAIADLNQDGHEDLVVSAPLADILQPDVGEVFVYYGPDFHEVASFHNPEFASNADYGAALAPADFDGDGIPELAVGAPKGPSTQSKPFGHVDFWRNAAVEPGIRLFSPPPPAHAPSGGWVEGFGTGLLSTDLDGDARNDLVAATARLMTPQGMSSQGLAAVYLSDVLRDPSVTALGPHARAAH